MNIKIKNKVQMHIITEIVYLIEVTQYNSHNNLNQNHNISNISTINEEKDRSIL